MATCKERPTVLAEPHPRLSELRQSQPTDSPAVPQDEGHNKPLMFSATGHR